MKVSAKASVQSLRFKRAIKCARIWPLFILVPLLLTTELVACHWCRASLTGLELACGFISHLLDPFLGRHECSQILFLETLDDRCAGLFVDIETFAQPLLCNYGWY